MAFIPKDYWERRLQKNYDLSGVGFAGLGVPFNEWMYRLRRHVFLKAIGRLTPDCSAWDVLDIGAGTGFYIECWHALGARTVAGADITEVAVRELTAKYPGDEFFCMDIGGPEAAFTRQVDCISAMDVLFHIVDDGRFDTALRNISAALKPGGYFVLSDNFLHGRDARGEHQVSRSLGAFTQALQKAGFVIESRRPAFILMNAPVDTKHEWITRAWQKGMRQLGRSNAAGYLAGAAFFAIDRVLIDILNESPTTEIMVCRKRV